MVGFSINDLESLHSVNQCVILYLFIYLFIFNFIHMCIQCLGHFCYSFVIVMKMLNMDLKHKI
jgi:hypothetical protein